MALQLGDWIKNYIWRYRQDNSYQPSYSVRGVPRLGKDDIIAAFLESDLTKIDPPDNPPDDSGLTS